MPNSSAHKAAQEHTEPVCTVESWRTSGLLADALAPSLATSVCAFGLARLVSWSALSELCSAPFSLYGHTRSQCTVQLLAAASDHSSSHCYCGRALLQRELSCGVLVCGGRQCGGRCGAAHSQDQLASAARW